MFSYNRLSSLGYMHDTVRHSAKQYVAGRVHTNNIEGMWSNVKRGIDGVNHAVSPNTCKATSTPTCTGSTIGAIRPRWLFSFWIGLLRYRLGRLS